MTIRMECTDSVDEHVNSHQVDSNGIANSGGRIDDMNGGNNSLDSSADSAGAQGRHQQREQSNASQVPITLVLFILISYIIIGTVIFSIWENWSLVDGAYFCVVTLSTIGFGDLVPKRTFHGPDIQLFACCAYLILGLVLVAMSFTLLETQLIWKCRRIAVRLKLIND